jgi:hypothetical protein
VDDAAVAAVSLVESRVEGSFTLGGSEILTVAEMLQSVCDVYLPGQRPASRDGFESPDQIIESSPGLPQGGSFRNAIERERLAEGAAEG